MQCLHGLIIANYVKGLPKTRLKYYSHTLCFSLSLHLFLSIYLSLPVSISFLFVSLYLSPFLSLYFSLSQSLSVSLSLSSLHICLAFSLLSLSPPYPSSLPSISLSTSLHGPRPATVNRSTRTDSNVIRCVHMICHHASVCPVLCRSTQRPVSVVNSVDLDSRCLV